MNKTIKLNEHGVEIRIDENGTHIVAKGFSFNSSPSGQTPEMTIRADDAGYVHVTGSEINFKSPSNE